MTRYDTLFRDTNAEENKFFSDTQIRMQDLFNKKRLKLFIMKTN